MSSNLVFQNSYWLIPACFVIGACYAWLLYSKKTTISGKFNIGLSIFRGLVVTLICFLILNPLLRTNISRSLKPILVIGLDNSGSMKEMGSSALKDMTENLKVFLTDIQDTDYEIELRLVEDKGSNVDLDSVEFSAKKSDLGSFFKSIGEEFNGSNLKKVVLVTDGIANSGLSPLLKPFPFKIETIGVGDSTIKRDIAIKGLTANKLAYLGNSFPVKVDISSKLFSGQNTTVLIKKDEDVIERKIIAFRSDDDFQSVTFQLEASDIGKQAYSVEVLTLNGEANTRNNLKDIVIDVVDGKEKILLVGLAPHPDIKALKSIIDKNPLFELEVRTIQIDESPEIENVDFDVLILHQLPDSKGVANNLTTRLLGKMKPTFFVLGTQSDLSRFNGMQEVVGITSQEGKVDKVTSAFNSNFARFISDDKNKNTISSLPPVISPFGEYRIFPGSDIILFQKVGSVLTERPLLAANTNASRKAAVFAAEGIWQWRMEEYFMNESHEAVDDYILKTLQLISVKEDKDKLRVYTTQSEIDVDESAIFMTEAYNDLFERIYDVDVSLSVSGPSSYSSSFNFHISENESSFELSDLGPGVYTFDARANVLGQSHSSSGQFVVKNKDLEFLNTTADFDFLRTLAQKNGGEFYKQNVIGDLTDKIKNEDIPSRLINTEDLREIINLKWILPLLLILLFLEWAIRKYQGTY